MNKWIGAAGVCINNENQLLMVLQGKPEEKKVWTVPSGALELNETIENCCIREIREETGYETRIVKPLFIKEGISYGITVEVHYFEVEVIGGKAQIQDPDHLIYEIAWKTSDNIMNLKLAFLEDRELLIGLLKEKSEKNNILKK
ncbi:NUDIX hydrolase [Bacillus sp. EAC]|uniref:NUDIX hydrolase n=1 Tax=Bacillus sp. EAC TaxID=1978338 RepID=UPI000B441C68|nr:NUDIX hydrolase [Bacillus sp. EAC]